ncbi:MAG: stage III sporulation protein AD [Clostridia bacterium]|nr:stage III sporulation protein AD [Clostridia bacterium]
MEAVKLAGFSIAAAMLALTVKRQQPPLGMALSLAAGTMLLLWAARQLGSVVETASQLLAQASLQGEMLKMLMKVLGISYLTEFAAQTCREAGEEGIAQKVTLAGKVMVLGLAMPIAGALVKLILSLAP